MFTVLERKKHTLSQHWGVLGKVSQMTKLWVQRPNQALWRKSTVFAAVATQITWWTGKSKVMVRHFTICSGNEIWFGVYQHYADTIMHQQGQQDSCQVLQMQGASLRILDQSQEVKTCNYGPVILYKLSYPTITQSNTKRHKTCFDSNAGLLLSTVGICSLTLWFR